MDRALTAASPTRPGQAHIEWGRCGTVRDRLCGQGMTTPVTGRRTRPFPTGERLDYMCVLSLYLLVVLMYLRGLHFPW